MAEIKFADLLKELPGTTIPRWTVLVDKINKKENFTIDKTTDEVKLNYLDKNIKGLFEGGKITDIQTTYRGKPLFKASNGKELKLGDLFKSSDFGGGKGSGGGAEETERNESAQCLYAGLIFYVYKKQTKTNKVVSKKDFTTAFRYCDVSAKFEDLIDLPKDWHESSILGANELLKRYKGKYEFHRGSSTVDIIEGAFKRINQREKAFGNLNKWSPADMYMFTNKGKQMVRTEIAQASTLQKLNSLMLKYYKSNDIVGVSLKKLQGSVKASENNVDKDKGMVKYKGTQIVAPNKKDLFDSMDIYLDHDKGRIQFRSFGGTSLTGWQGEGKGTSANQGKVSLGPLNYILQSNGIKPIPESQVSAKNAMNPSNTYFAEFYQSAKKLKVKGLPPNQKTFEARWKTMPKPWCYSKYLGIMLATRFNDMSLSKRHSVLTDIYLYAASKASFSGVYLKLE